MIKPDAVRNVGEIVERIQNEDFVINQLKKVDLSRFDLLFLLWFLFDSLEN